MGQNSAKTCPHRTVTTGAGGERRHAVWTIGAEELACQARQGSSAAFAELVDRFGGRLLMYLRHKTGNWHDAEDLVQETFVRAYQNLDRFREVQRFSTWVFTIASRLAISHYRKRREEKILPETESILAGPLAELMRQETHQGLWATAQELSATQFEVLWLIQRGDGGQGNRADHGENAGLCEGVALSSADQPGKAFAGPNRGDGGF